MAPVKLRRLRGKEQLRDLVSQTQILAKNLVMPYFVVEGRDKKEPIKTMPGICRLSIDNLIKDIKEARSLGIKAILLFGVSHKKDLAASEAYRKDGIIQQTVRRIKKDIKDIIVITDVCLCGYTSHGHCGIVKSRKSEVRSHKEFTVDNSETLKILSKVSLSHAKAGADFVAPSAMMDGQVEAIRETLDNNGYQDTGILAYSAKYASNFYAPFREALESRPQFADRKTYQMDSRNSDEALREIKQDIDEGADIVMVKPALAYLDIIHRAKQNFNIPIVAYNVSGEYAMVKAYCQGTETEENLTLEILTSIKRAGADLIISYHAKEVAEWLKH